MLSGHRQSQSTHRPSGPLVTRRSPQTPRVYGYVLSDAWLKDYVAKHNLDDPNVAYSHIKFRAITRVLREAGVTNLFSVRWEGNPGTSMAFAVAVATNKSREVYAKLTAPERIARIQKALDTKDAPAWYIKC